MAESSLAQVRGSKDTPLLTWTIGETLAQAVRSHGARPALVVPHQNVRLDYVQFSKEVDDFAAGLLELGLAPGDRVAIWAPNCAEWVIAQFATARVGLILVTINPAYRAYEFEWTMEKVGARALILTAKYKTSDYLAMLRAATLPSLEFVILIGGEKADGVLPFADVSARGRSLGLKAVEQAASKVKADDAINIQFTSGTTGSPKGATLSHTNIVNNGWLVAQRMNFGPEDRLCIPVPLYHCFGMVMSSLACVTTGACMVFPGEGFDPRAVLETVAAERCTALHGVPTMFIAELALPDRASYDLSSLRTGIMAGAPCPIEVMRRVIDELSMSEITIAYGMTETSPVSFQTEISDPIERRVETVGRIHPHLEAKVVNEAGETVAFGETGEFLVRGYSVMKGYWGDPAATEAVIDSEGWMHSGDLATIDAAGYCAIVGRLKDMVIRGGENIYPREVEEFLFGHPKIASVQVFGVPDNRMGEELAAWIVLAPGADATSEEIAAYCKGKIAHYKVPRYIRFVDAFPMTITGKPQKYLMREAMAAELSAAT